MVRRAGMVEGAQIDTVAFDAAGIGDPVAASERTLAGDVGGEMVGAGAAR